MPRGEHAARFAIITAALAICWVLADSEAPTWTLPLLIVATFVLSTLVYATTARVSTAALATAEQLRRERAHAQSTAAHATQRAVAATDALHASAEYAVRTEEQVRALFVSELHDSVAQTLTAFAFLQGDPDITPERLLDLARQAEDELREVMVSQRPIAESGTMAAMVAGLVEEMRLRRSMRVEVDWDDDCECMFTVPIAHTIYRFLNEVLLYLYREHGAESGIRLRMQGHSATVAFSVHARGVIMTEHATSNTARIVEALLRHRAEQVGATIEIADSDLVDGSMCTLTVPGARPADVSSEDG